MFSLFCFLLAILASPFKSKSRLEAENDRDGAYGSEKVMSWHSVQELGTKQLNVFRCESCDTFAAAPASEAPTLWFLGAIA